MFDLSDCSATAELVLIAAFKHFEQLEHPTKPADFKLVSGDIQVAVLIF